MSGTGKDVSELPDAVPDELAEIEILVVEDSVLGQELLVDGATQVGIRVGLNLRRPRVGADADDLPIGQPPGDLEADTRLAGVELRVVLHPEAALPEGYGLLAHGRITDVARPRG